MTLKINFAKKKKTRKKRKSAEKRYSQSLTSLYTYQENESEMKNERFSRVIQEIQFTN